MPALFENIQELYQYRALLWSLIVRELQVRYRGSMFGFVWTFLNPVLQMAVYALVFKVYMRNDLPNYTYFLFVGLLPWNWAATSIITGTSAISDRRDLITKVKFPPQILPAMVIGSSLANYLLTLPLMLGLGALHGVYPNVTIIAFPLVVFVQLVLITGIVYLLATLHITFRDLQHIMGNLVMFAFFLTPILYAPEQIPEMYRTLANGLNPFAPLMASYQAIFSTARGRASSPCCVCC
jgi:lipopolysaccharide transport system permease protein